MIKRFISIKDFGVFNNFSWTSDPNLQEFTEKNILYGWNYSGKTTLSRIFSFIRDKSIPIEFKDIKFKIKLKDGNEYTQDNISTIPLDVKVFNSDYIKENLHWETDNEINGISFAVGEVAHISIDIAKNERRILSIDGDGTTKGVREKYQPSIDTYNEFENTLFTDISRDIQNKVFNSLIKFNKGDFKKTDAFKSSKLADYKISDKDELKRLTTISIAKNDKDELVSPKYSLNLNDLYDSVKKLMISQPTKSDLIEILYNSKVEYDWVQGGLKIHKEINSKKCLFCGNDIQENRFENLNRYFSSAESILKNKINEFKENIKIELSLIEQINLPKSTNDFADSFKEEYQKKTLLYNEFARKYKDELNYLLKCLDRKEAGNIFNSLSIKTYDNKIQSNLNEVLKECQKLINAHNELRLGFEKIQTNARSKIINHYVAEFLIVNRFKQKEKSYSTSLEKLEQCNRIVSFYRKKNIELTSKLKSVDLGREELENFIKKFLNRNDIQIGLSQNEKFFLKRGEKIAKHLSEGEKTAISFSHFLVMLESLHKDNKLINTVIFIDDPISSLDSNHTAQVCSLINTFFFRKGLIPESPDKVSHCFSQLFISTHNFDFYSFIRDARQMTKKDKNDRNTMLSSYLIRKIDNNNSVITCMPKSIKSFKSEYVYLFSIIYNFYLSGCNEDNENLILMPNAIRRFLEIYTLLKIPGSTDEVDNRVKELIGEPNELKVLHHFSHFTSFEKISKHDELIMKLPDLTSDLISLLKKDPTHYESLISAI
ncbi:MAG: hypothetical protein H6Q12_246 [Bacteroidetes bacterium]|nr:hypothetical protein [Bacteroidota bacterium]